MTEVAAGTPRTRQRIHKTPPPLDVPDIDEDAAERKRVLNVLAQRRYREKKRLARLKDKGPKNSTSGGNSGSSVTTASPGQSEDQTSASSATEASGDATSSLPPDMFEPMDDIEQILPAAEDMSTWDMSLGGSMPSFLPDADSSMSGLASLGNASWHHVPSSDGTIAPGFLDAFSSSETSSSPNSTSLTSYDSTPSDSYLLPVHELTILKALLRIATRLGCTEQLWSLDALSSFNTNTSPPHESLPEVWRPTASQIMTPHHPLIDFLPWPGVRDRLLAIMTLPAESRPPSVGGEMWFLNLVYDLEDNAEGIRIYGGDPYDPDSWEVGQVLFERWWFVFDRKVVERSNSWRELRGAPALTTESRVSEL